jgi:nucleotide-binding universal stress UspA family protein
VGKNPRRVAIKAQEYRNVVVGYDGTEGARAALARAASVADTEGASLTLVHASSDEAGARHSLDDAIGSLQPALEGSPWIVAPPAAAGILAVADEVRADLIVTGSRARGQVMRAVLGSVSTELVHNAPCDVLVVHPPSE